MYLFRDETLSFKNDNSFCDVFYRIGGIIMANSLWCINLIATALKFVENKFNATGDKKYKECIIWLTKAQSLTSRGIFEDDMNYVCDRLNNAFPNIHIKELVSNVYKNNLSINSSAKKLNISNSTLYSLLYRFYEKLGNEWVYECLANGCARYDYYYSEAVSGIRNKVGGGRVDLKLPELLWPDSLTNVVTKNMIEINGCGFTVSSLVARYREALKDKKIPIYYSEKDWKDLTINLEQSRLITLVEYRVGLELLEKATGKRVSKESVTSYEKASWGKKVMLTALGTSYDSPFYKVVWDNVTDKKVSILLDCIGGTEKEVILLHFKNGLSIYDICLKLHLSAGRITKVMSNAFDSLIEEEALRFVGLDSIVE